MPLPPSQSPVFAKAKEIAKAAAADFLGKGTDPSEAIAKHAESLFSDPFIDLCVSQTNHAIFRDLRQTDKLAEYPVALADKVKLAMSKMQKAASEQVVSDVWSRDISNAALTKVGTRTRDGVDIDAFGIPLNLQEPPYNMTKVAEAKLVSDYWTAKGAAELEKQAEYELERLFADTKTAVCDYIRKQAALGQDAFATGFGLVSNVDQEKKANAALFVDRCVRGMIAAGVISKVAAQRYDETMKTAALDFLDNATPVARGAEHIILQLNTLVQAAESGSNEPRFAGPGTYAPAGAMDKIKYKVEGVSHAPQGGSGMLSRGATSLGMKLW